MAAIVVGYSTSQPQTSRPSVAPSSILSRLRMETRDEHNAVEQVLDLMSTSLTPDGYRQRLAQFYGFYAPLEKALERSGEGQIDALHLSSDTRLAMALRLNKAALLKLDLQHLGVDTNNLPLCRDLPPLETQADVLGCMYVMEGATLGGRLITQHVRATLGITLATGGRFFDGYGDDTGVMWHGMRELLVKSAPDSDTQDAMVYSAIATFSGLRGWCESSQKQ
jgi:heme oxygenase (biliverdin-IX-beta and delta-forming)